MKHHTQVQIYQGSTMSAMLPGDKSQQSLLYQQLLKRQLVRQLAQANSTHLPQTTTMAVTPNMAVSAALAAVTTAPPLSPGLSFRAPSTMTDASRRQTSLPSSTTRNDTSSLLQMMLSVEQERRLQQHRRLSGSQQLFQSQVQQLQQNQIQQQQQTAYPSSERLVPSNPKPEAGNFLFGGSAWTTASRSELAVNNTPKTVRLLGCPPNMGGFMAAEATPTMAPVAPKAQGVVDNGNAFVATDIQEPEQKDLKRKSAAGGMSRKDARWEEMYQELLEYKRKTGTCIVPRGFAENPRLASWVAEQRKQYKLMRDGRQSSITARRVELLNQVDFAWNAQEAAWEKHMVDLKTFKQRHGHCSVPLNDPQFPKLGLWVKEQRRHYTLMKQGKQSHMTELRCRELDSVGFCWDTHEATWLERLNELLAFKNENGHCIVPTNYPQNPKLGTWIHHQRRQYKKYKEGKPCHITEERIKALDSLGFVWHPRDKCADVLSPGDKKAATDLATLDLRPRKRQRHA
ncbi:helicase [Seminavis robusta]|uniref:Helicase n=1 Tax=Seminavis robusta TaxID=568900 RepID=A0A9N8EA78_9STRA|nr:helicase [Seminavis robusta]|eukprot:Sro872_g213960.1 helicase (514) ;mRNA; f:38734-40350